MNGKLKQSSGMLSVKELRAFLDAHEAQWTNEDREYLGEFEDQRILSLIPGSGYSSSMLQEAYGCGGFFIIPTDQDGRIIQ